MIKCVGCLGLRMEEIRIKDKTEVVYDCILFPYMTTISGLLRPGEGIIKATKDCQADPLSHCILCAWPWVTSYGFPPNVFACKEHDRAWGKWLNDHPDRHAYISPIGRLRKANWVEVFREFIEDMREK